ncbi:MAG: hypothetical protein HC850_10465 [Rhodomicrobium sp.]|nr:hypothetical protein [Rhodomicrobium sp.]
MILAAACLGALAACGGASSSDGLNAQAPVALTPAREQTGGQSALTGQVNDAEVRKAVERYGITKQRKLEQYDITGVDLNGDGRSEALVLFTGQDWCQRTGCSLVVFQEEQTGYRPVSHMISVRPPLLVGPESSFGWRDLMVRTGGGPAPIRTVRLGFTGKGYPANALLQPEPVSEMLARSQEVMAESSAFAAALNRPPS